MGFLSANGATRKYHGEYIPSALTNIDIGKSKLLGRNVKQMSSIALCLWDFPWELPQVKGST